MRLPGDLLSDSWNMRQNFCQSDWLEVVLSTNKQGTNIAVLEVDLTPQGPTIYVWWSQYLWDPDMRDLVLRPDPAPRREVTPSSEHQLGAPGEDCDR